MSSVPLLQAADVTYAYPAGPAALDGLTVDVIAGERLVILGGNGSGKSSLLLTLNGTYKPDSGAVMRRGEPLRWTRRARNEHRRSVGLVLQDPDDQVFSASVLEDVSFGPLNMGLTEADARQRVHDVLDALDLAAIAERPAHLLSYGQRKRVAIAGVAAMRPEVILLDEPFSGLDPLARVDVLAALEQLESQGTTVVLTTHDVDLAFAWSDRCVLLDAGRVVASGPPDDVLCDEEACRAARLVPAPLASMVAVAVDRGWLPPAVAATVRTLGQLVDALRLG
ncbi:MAG: ABC transporter ATP-binding protein [Actinomycetota bacterium]